jgi:hypothetical protein
MELETQDYLDDGVFRSRHGADLIDSGESECHHGLAPGNHEWHCYYREFPTST